MKSSKRETTIVVIMLVLLALMYASSNRRVERAERKASLESIKTDFLLSNMGIKNEVYDSVYAKDDTVSFYKNGSYVGMTVTVTE